VELTVAGIELDAVSVGGVETCIGLPRQRLCFDIGRCPDEAVNWPTVLFTHAHMDHMGGVAWHAATRALRRLAPPTYVVGPEHAEALRSLFEVWRRLDRSELPHELIVLDPGQEWVLPNKWVARPFRSPHRAPCQGYALYERRRKLLPEYAGLPEAELLRIKSTGAAISAEREICQLAFTGDTLIEVVEREEAVRRARVLVMEVTFVDERVSVEECRSKGHVHLDEMAERAGLFQNEALVLTHFSSRYRPAEILRALDHKLPVELRRRVVPLLPDRSGIDSRGESRATWSG
jgi:ribonuclease Z